MVLLAGRSPVRRKTASSCTLSHACGVRRRPAVVADHEVNARGFDALRCPVRVQVGVRHVRVASPSRAKRGCSAWDRADTARHLTIAFTAALASPQDRESAPEWPPCGLQVGSAGVLPKGFPLNRARMYAARRRTTRARLTPARGPPRTALVVAAVVAVAAGFMDTSGTTVIFAGNGSSMALPYPAFVGDGGPATEAPLCHPSGVAYHDGDVFITDAVRAAPRVRAWTRRLFSFNPRKHRIDVITPALPVQQPCAPSAYFRNDRIVLRRRPQ